MLKMKHYQQSVNSWCCGPYAVKSIIDYFNGKSPNKRQLFYECKLNRKVGTDSKDLKKVLKDYGLNYQKIQLKNFYKALRRKNPILVLLKTDTDEWHWTIVKGYDSKMNIFTLNDSYYGKNFKIGDGMLNLLLNKTCSYEITKGTKYDSNMGRISRRRSSNKN